jgi:hypothetical protein
MTEPFTLEYSVVDMLDVALDTPLPLGSTELLRIATLVAAVSGADECTEWDVQDGLAEQLRFTRRDDAALTMFASDDELRQAVKRLHGERVVAAHHKLYAMVVEVAIGFEANDILCRYLMVCLQGYDIRRVVVSQAAAYQGEVVEIFLPGFDTPADLRNLERVIASNLGCRW